jgi:hypothetical protein
MTALRKLSPPAFASLGPHGLYPYDEQQAPPASGLALTGGPSSESNKSQQPSRKGIDLIAWVSFNLLLIDRPSQLDGADHAPWSPCSSYEPDDDAGAADEVH